MKLRLFKRMDLECAGNVVAINFSYSCSTVIVPVSEDLLC
jgi:hypothetical protein